MECKDRLSVWKNKKQVKNRLERKNVANGPKLGFFSDCLPRKPMAIPILYSQTWYPKAWHCLYQKITMKYFQNILLKPSLHLLYLSE